MESLETMDGAKYAAARSLMIHTERYAPVRISKTGLVFVVLVVLLDLLAGFYLSTSTIAYGQTRTNYISRQYKFILEYSAGYKLKRFADGFFALIGGQKVKVRSSIEDDTFRIFLRESKEKRDGFKSFASERVKVVCTADGPDGSSYCDNAESVREGTTRGGLRYLEYYLVMTREDSSTQSKERSRVGPIYFVDISQPAQPLALMIFPGYGTLASQDDARVIREMVETVRLDE
jgi:hypothetical protein